MNNETRCEIIKALALGFTATEISKIEEISVEEVEQVAYDDADRVQREKEYFKQARGH